MAKVVINANKLEQPTVEWLSLVERGANRAPFKIIKQHKGNNMGIDLGSLFIRKADKKEVVAPVAAFVVDADSAEKAQEALAAAGFVAEKQEDGSVVLKMQASAVDAGGGGAADTGAVTHTPAVDTGARSDLTAPVQSGDVIVTSAVSGGAGKEKAPEGAAGMPASAVDAGGAGAQDTGMVAVTVTVNTTGSTIKEGEMAAAPAVEEDYTDGKGGCKEGYELKDGKCVPVMKADEVQKTVADLDAAAVAAEDAKAKNQAEETQTAIISAVTGMVKAEIAKVMEAVAAQGVSLTAKIGEVETVAKAAQASVKGTVVGAPPAQDAETRTAKAEVTAEDGTGEIYDTAFQPGVRKQTLGYRNPNLGLVRARR